MHQKNHSTTSIPLPGPSGSSDTNIGSHKRSVSTLQHSQLRQGDGFGSEKHIPNGNANYNNNNNMNDVYSRNNLPVSGMMAQQTYNKHDTPTHMYKIVLVGDAGVGKTHIISRYVKGVSPAMIIPTIGVEFATKTVTLRDGGSIKTQIWDTAGQERYRSITSAHYRKAVGAMLVYDVTKEKSFDSILRWLKEIRLHADPQIILFLVGNKVDLTKADSQARRVLKETAENFAKENGMLFEESSAVCDVNITEAFERLLEEIYEKKSRFLHDKSLHNITDQEDVSSMKHNQVIDLKNFKSTPQGQSASSQQQQQSSTMQQQHERSNAHNQNSNCACS